MPCAYKQLFGIDCPFCGGQRAVGLFLEGHVTASLRMFPALLPLVITPFFIGHRKALPVMLWVDLAIVIGSWLLRLFLG